MKVPLFITLSTCRLHKKEINTSPCLRLAILEDICKINGLFFFTLFPHLPLSPHLWSIKEPGIHTQNNMVILRCCHLLDQPAFQTKFLASTSCLSESLACHVASRVNLDSVTVTRAAAPRKSSKSYPKEIRMDISLMGITHGDIPQPIPYISRKTNSQGEKKKFIAVLSSSIPIG